MLQLSQKLLTTPLRCCPVGASLELLDKRLLPLAHICVPFREKAGFQYPFLIPCLLRFCFRFSKFLSSSLDAWSRTPGAKPISFDVKLQIPLYALNDPERRKQLLGQVRWTCLWLLLL